MSNGSKSNFAVEPRTMWGLLMAGAPVGWRMERGGKDEHLRRDAALLCASGCPTASVIQGEGCERTPIFK